MTQYTNPRLQATIEGWPYGRDLRYADVLALFA